MSWTSFCTKTFFFAFFAFLAVHFAYVKAPTQHRSVASSHELVRPMYDAAWKY